MFEQVFYGFMKRAQEHNVPEGEARSLFDKIAGARQYIASLLSRIKGIPQQPPAVHGGLDGFIMPPSNRNMMLGAGAVGTALGTGLGLNYGVRSGLSDGHELGLAEGVSQGIDRIMPAANHLLEASKAQKDEGNAKALKYLLGGSAAGLGIGALAGSANNKKEKENKIAGMLGFKQGFDDVSSFMSAVRAGEPSHVAAAVGATALAGAGVAAAHKKSLKDYDKEKKKEKKASIPHSKSEFYIDGFLKAARDSGMTEGQAVDAYTALVANANNGSVKEADDNALMQLISQNPQLAGMLQGQQPAPQQGAGPDISSLIQQLLGRAGGQGGQPGTGAEMFKGSVMPQQAMG